MTGVIPGAAVDLTSFLLDKIILWVSSSFPSNLFSPLFSSLLHPLPFYRLLQLSICTVFSLCVWLLQNFTFSKLKSGVCSNEGRFFFFFFNAETSAEYFSFCCFPHKPISLGERWEWKSCCLGCWFLCILYKTYVNVSPLGWGLHSPLGY